MFEKPFPCPAYDGVWTACEVDGFQVSARIYADQDTGPPWEDFDGHGPVSRWTTRDKLPGERVLMRDGDSRRYYDFAAAVALAKRDGWDTPPLGTGTRGERAARAADADFKRLRSWCEDEWHYVGVAVRVSRNGVELTGEYDNALWGIESDAGAYLLDVANDLLPDALAAARATLAKLCVA